MHQTGEVAVESRFVSVSVRHPTTYVDARLRSSYQESLEDDKRPSYVDKRSSDSEDLFGFFTTQGRILRM